MKKQLLNNAKYAKLWVLTLTGITLLATNAMAQLTGVKTIPGDYASLSAAVAALNSNGVGSGGVTFNISAGYTETISEPLSITATGTVANPIVFQKSGAGANPLITSYTGGTATAYSTIQDGIWNLVGSDYVTIDGINLMENPLNMHNSTRMEYGIAFFKNGSIDGCQNNTIKNCTITLDRKNDVPGAMFSGSTGIAVVNAIVSNMSSGITIFEASGSNSNNKFYANTIQNCNNAILLSGFAALPPYTLGDQNNDIGGSSPATGNTFVNFGGASFSTIPSSAVIIKDQWGFNVAHNTINNNNGSGVNHPYLLRGIFTSGSNGANASITHNTITLNGAGTIAQVTPIENGAGSLASGNTIDISNNTIMNCTYTDATSGVFYGIYNTASPEYLMIRNNTFTNNTTAANNGSYYTIYSTGAANTLTTINKNTINGLTFTASVTNVAYRGIFTSGTGNVASLNIDSNTIQNIMYAGGGTGEFSGIYTSSIVQNCAIRNNTITSINLPTTGTTYMVFASYVMPTVGSARTKEVTNNTISAINRKGQSGTMYGYYCVAASVAVGNSTNISHNTFTDLKVTGSSALTVIHEVGGPTTSPFGPTKTVTNNTITNLTASTGAVTGMLIHYSNQNAAANNVSLNTISNITSSGSITGTTVQAPSSLNFFSNTINGLNSAGTGAKVMGMAIDVTGTTFTFTGYTNRMYNNKIYDLSATDTLGVVTGMSFAGGTSIVYNNLISDLKTANANNTNAINGMILSNGVAANLYNNTVYLNATSTGMNFGTTALNITSATTNITLRNNIFVNTSTPKGTALTVAQRRGSATSVFSSASDKNLYYAGTPGPSNLIYTDGTNNYDNISNYIALVGPTAETNSVSQNVSFISASGSDADFLKPNGTIPTLIESGGMQIAGLDVDYSGVVRAGSEFYSGTGAAPDLGAIEGNYTGSTVIMVHDSSNADQITGVISRGNVQNVQMLRIRVYGKNAGTPLNISSFKFTTAGTTASADIEKARVYYTGSSSTFTNTTQYGSTVNAPGGTFYVTGSKNMLAGVNYFWLVYDINASTVTGNTFDATIDSIRMSGVNYAPIDNNPSGSRTIKNQLSGNYNIGVTQSAPHYNTINAALADLNTLGVSGPVTFTLTDAVYNIGVFNITSVPFTITPFAGASPTNTVTLRPADAVTATINESFAGPIFNLSGVNYFRIDGRQAVSLTPNSLIVQNDSLSGSVVDFVNDASNNRLEYAVFKGASNRNAVGVINFNTGIVTGNDNNVIDHCNIGDAATTPATLVQALGSVAGASTEIYNDNNTISNCNLYNFWHSTAESNAFKILNGNNYWTISGNSIYQTASRSGSVAASLYYTFNLNNSGNIDALNGFTITGNYIGGSAPLCGGSPWTVTSTLTAQNTNFTMGYYVTSRFSQNTMANYSFTTTSTSSTGTGLLSFVQHINGKMNIDSNTIGSATALNSIVINGGSAGAFLPIFSSVTAPAGTYSISGNTFGGIRVNGGGTNANSFIAISVTASPASMAYNINDNIIGNNIPDNIVADASTAGTQVLRGILNSSSANITVSGNLIHNLTNLSTATATGAGLVNGITITGGKYTIVNNTIDSLATQTPQAGTFANSSVIGIVLNSPAGYGLASQNKIYGLVNKSTSGNVLVNGILILNGSNDLIARNIVHSLTTASSSLLSQVNGIFIGSGTVRVTNNMVRLGINEAGTHLTATPIISGISKGAANLEAYFNTVFIGGRDVPAVTARTYAFNRTGAGSDIVMNNIFVNKRSNIAPIVGGGGGHFAVGLNNNAINLNTNIYYANGTDGYVGILGATNAGTMQDWKVLTGIDGGSAFADPGMINDTGDIATMDLHIRAAITTAMEGQGSPISGIGVDVDYDGQLRSSLTPSDIGADAGLFTARDLCAPVISYNALGHTEMTGNRIITATITDATGIYLANPLFIPHINFKKMSAGAWHTVPGTFVSGSKTNSIWNFTIDTSMIGGLVTADSVFYYIVAQDSATTGSSFVASVPGGAVTDTASVRKTDPLTLNVYRILEQVEGNIDVGTGLRFESLSGGNGVFNYLNSSVIKGDITITIKSSMRESGAIGLNQMVETGPGNYTIRVVPDAAVERLIYSTLTTSQGMIRINGADRVTFDGRFNGSGRYLKFVDTNAFSPVIYILNDSHCDTVMYCTILGNCTSTTGMGDITFGASTSGSGNDSNAIMYCYIGSINKAITTYQSTFNISSCGIVRDGNPDPNSANTIAYNEIAAGSWGAINLVGVENSSPSSTGNNWRIYNNYIYADTLLIMPSSSTLFEYNVIGALGGSGHIIRNNSIGGKAVDRSGLAFAVRGTSSQFNFSGINVSPTTGLPITVDSNSFGNITTGYPVGLGTTFLQMIVVKGGVVDVNNNNIGNPTPAFPADSIYNSTGPNIIGIRLQGGTVNVTGNKISHLIMRSTQTNPAFSCTGISTLGAAATTIGNISDNIISDMTSHASDRTLNFSVTGINIGTGSFTVDHNRIYNITNNNGGMASGIIVTGGYSHVVSRNRIYNMNSIGTSAGSASPMVYNIYNSGNTHLFKNNQITSGSKSVGETRVYGIADESNAGVNRYYYNSVLINGNTTSGLNSSYAMRKGTSGGNLIIWNNILYNKRTTGGSGYNVAFAAANPLDLNRNTLNHNLFVTNDTNRVLEMGSGVMLGAWDCNNTFPLSMNTYNTNWIEKSDNVKVDSLFADSTVGDLGIKPMYTQSWYVNGKGRAVADAGEDFNNISSVRSVSIATGATDIGSVEFTPSAGVLPISAKADRVISHGDSTTYTFASRQIAKVKWGYTGSLPFDLDVKYYSGVNPSNTTAGSTFTNAYWDIVPNVGFDYSFSLDLSHDSSMLGTASDLSAIKLVRYIGPSSLWAAPVTTVVNNLTGTLSATGLNAFGIYTGTNGSENPLPVELLAFNASAVNNNVHLAWSTASELNNAGFAIERSVDGKNFKEIDFVKSTGKTNGVSNYERIDHEAFGKSKTTVLYYRLRQQDFNGRSVYSSIETVVKTDIKKVQYASVFPNPFNDQLTVKLESKANETATIKVYDITGKELVSTSRQLVSGTNQFVLDGMNGLQPGIYFMSIDTNTDKQVMKLIKE